MKEIKRVRMKDKERRGWKYVKRMRGEQIKRIRTLKITG